VIWLWLTLTLIAGVATGLGAAVVSLTAYMRRHPIVAFALLATRPDLAAELRRRNHAKRPLSAEAQRIVDFASAIHLPLEPWQIPHLEDLVANRQNRHRSRVHPGGFDPTPRIDLDKARRFLAEHSYPMPSLSEWLDRCSSQARLTSEERAALIRMWDQRVDQLTPRPPTGAVGVSQPRRAPRPKPPDGRGPRADRVLVDEVLWLDSTDAPGPQGRCEPPDFDG
jgi:hypothetical protein